MALIETSGNIGQEKKDQIINYESRYGGAR